MRIKTQELTSPALDWAVAKCEGHAVTVLTVDEQRARWFEYVDSKDLEKEQRDFDQYILPTLKPKLAVVGEDNYKRNPTHAEAPMLWGQGIPHFAYGTSWAQGGPIIEREGIIVGKRYAPKFLPKHSPPVVDWTAQYFEAPHSALEVHRQFGPTPLVAAMRCFVASRLGDEVDIPEDLCASIA